jgi:hypothetical protein
MPSTRDIILGENFKALFIGATGNRKTASACSFYEQGPVWVGDFDGKLDVVKEIFPSADVEYETYGPSNYYKFLSKVREQIEKFTPNKGTIVIDSFTMLTTSIINWQMDIKAGGSDRKVTKSGLVVPSWDEFNGEVSEVTKLLELLKTARCNVIMTAHPVKKTKIEGGVGVVVESIASMGVKSPDLVPGYFKEVYYFKLESNIDANKGPNFIVQTQPSSECFARTNLGLPPKITLSNDTSLYKEIQKFKKV